MAEHNCWVYLQSQGYSDVVGVHVQCTKASTKDFDFMQINEMITGWCGDRGSVRRKSWAAYQPLLARAINDPPAALQ